MIYPEDTCRNACGYLCEVPVIFFQFDPNYIWQILENLRNIFHEIAFNGNPDVSWLLAGKNGLVDFV
jgi:hypothetical protein